MFITTVRICLILSLSDKVELNLNFSSVLFQTEGIWNAILESAQSELFEEVWFKIITFDVQHIIIQLIALKYFFAALPNCKFCVVVSLQLALPWLCPLVPQTWLREKMFLCTVMYLGVLLLLLHGPRLAML